MQQIIKKTAPRKSAIKTSPSSKPKSSVTLEKESPREEATSKSTKTVATPVKSSKKAATTKEVNLTTSPAQSSKSLKPSVAKKGTPQPISESVQSPPAKMKAKSAQHKASQTKIIPPEIAATPKPPSKKTSQAKTKNQEDRKTTAAVNPATLDVRAIRESLNMTHREFAATFHIRLHTLKHWEGHWREPGGVARIYLMLIAKKPEVMIKALREIAQEALFANGLF